MSKTHQRHKNKNKQSFNPLAKKAKSPKSSRVPHRQGGEVKLLAILLVVVCGLVFAVHRPVLTAMALSFDDDQYLTENRLVHNPGVESVRRFLTEVLEPSTVKGYYQPLTMISLMCDYALGGRNDNLMSFHRTSLILHMINTALVIVLLYLLFRRVWIAAAVGLLFGLHPMTVETIAWVGERKTLLATFFALWCLILYIRFTRTNHRGLYATCLVMYVLAVMSKPTSLPLPILMVLTDYWPLCRLKWQTIIQKLPFFAIAGVFAVITYISQTRTAFTALPGEYNAARIPLILCHNIIFYLYKIIWPVNLSSHYAFPPVLGVSSPMVLAGVVGTVVLILLLIISMKWTRSLFIGWLFFFVAILPTMQIVGFSNVIASDKFAYLPSVGLMMSLAALLNWFYPGSTTRKFSPRPVILTMIFVALAATESVATRRYLACWRNTETLYNHMLIVKPNATPLHYNLGNTLKEQGRFDEALRCYNRVLKIEPDHIGAHSNLGNMFEEQGRLDEALRCYNRILKIEPDHAGAHNNLGNILGRKGRYDEAIRHYQQALNSDTEHPELQYYNLAFELQSQNKFAEAIAFYRKAIEIKDDYFKAHNNLAVLLAQKGKLQDAANHFAKALEIKPLDVSVQNNLGSALASMNRVDEALAHFETALKIDPTNITTHYNLAITFESQRMIEKAVIHYSQILQIDQNHTQAKKKLQNLRRSKELN